MASYDNNIENKILRYIQGKMDKTEISEFRKKIKADDTLREEVEMTRNLKFIQQNEELLAVKKAWQESVKDLKIEPDFDLEELNQNIPTDPKHSIFPKVLIGVLIVALPIAIWWFNSKTETLPPPQLDNIIATYSEPYENVISIEENENSVLALGMKAYDEANYKEAITHLSRFDTSDPSNDFFKLYLGISYYLDDQLDNAKNVLAPLANANEVYSPSAKWYLALIALKNRNLEPAIELLESLKGNEYHGQDAEELLSIMSDAARR